MTPNTKQIQENTNLAKRHFSLMSPIKSSDGLPVLVYKDPTNYINLGMCIDDNGDANWIDSVFKRVTPDILHADIWQGWVENRRVGATYHRDAHRAHKSSFTTSNT